MPETTQSNPPGKAPIKEFRAKGGVRAAIWQEEITQKGRVFHRFTVKVSRSYRDKNDQWMTTDAFAEYDLPRLEVVVRQAMEYIATNDLNSDADTPI